MTARELPSGVWRHYKGPLYCVLGYGHDANDEKRSTVVYIGLELDAAHVGGRFATRTASDFFARVCANLECARYGKECGDVKCWECEQPAVERFVYQSPTYEGAS